MQLDDRMCAIACDGKMSQGLAEESEGRGCALGRVERRGVNATVERSVQEHAAKRNAATSARTAAKTTAVTSATTGAGDKNTDETRKGKGEGNGGGDKGGKGFQQSVEKMKGEERQETDEEDERR